jgi:hypothetical protein
VVVRWPRALSVAVSRLAKSYTLVVRLPSGSMEAMIRSVRVVDDGLTEVRRWAGSSALVVRLPSASIWMPAEQVDHQWKLHI